MPARYSRISCSTSSTLSLTTYLVPSTRNATVSGCPSTRSIRSGLSANRSPFRRVTRITAGPQGCSGGARPCAPSALFTSARRVRRLSRTARLTRHRKLCPRYRAGYRGQSFLCRGRHVSALEVDQVLQDLVGGGDH